MEPSRLGSSFPPTFTCHRVSAMPRRDRELRLPPLFSHMRGMVKNRPRLRRWYLRAGFAVLLGFPLFATNSTFAEPPGAKPVDFVQDIKPILASHCFQCHGPEDQQGGLRLDHRERAFLGGDSGPILEPNGELIRRITSNDEGEKMPPPWDEDAKPLSSGQVEILSQWIATGHTWPAEETANDTTVSNHWSFQAIKRPAVPSVGKLEWSDNPVDGFIFSRLTDKGIALSPEANRFTLIRRLYYDLLGLPPSPGQVDAFVSDDSPEAYHRLVDRLLASPRFGERWGRHWLDQARYADSDGYEKDNPRPNAWRYRDWVIGAINADMAFDQFTIEQLAGDLLPDATDSQKLATAFHRQTLTNTEGGTDQEEFRVAACVDRANTTGTVWLGLTVGCAQCHTHKYDPITQAEYYQLFAFFNNGDESILKLPISPEAVRRYEAAKRDYDPLVAAAEKELDVRRTELAGKVDELERKLQDELAAEIRTPPAENEDQVERGEEEQDEDKVPPDVREALSVKTADRTAEQNRTLMDFFLSQDERGRELLAKLNRLKKEAPTEPIVNLRVITQRVEDPRTTYVLRRGDFLQPIKETEVQPTGLAVLPDLQSRDDSSTADRLDLAKWLVNKNNPMTPRVIANDIWSRLFGRGIVRTKNDFGVRGEPPTHPHLLDWLASELVSNGWSRKQLIRTIVLSASYRQDSVHRVELADMDPRNDLFHRQNRFRVEAETVRDICLDVAELLSNQIGGPSVYPPMPADVAALSYANNFTWRTSDGGDRYRRGMYTFFKRTAPHPNLSTFDCPDANTTSVERPTSNTPLQALTTLNNGVFVEAAQAMSRRLLARSEVIDEEAALNFAFCLCVARQPTPVERTALLELLAESRTWFHTHQVEAKKLAGNTHRPDTIDAAEFASWVAICRVLMNMDEFITRE